VSIIAVEDLGLEAITVASTTFRSFETYMIVTAIYIVMTLTISTALKLLARRFFRQTA
jgi:polar amino acid transport system permease protein